MHGHDSWVIKVLLSSTSFCNINFKTGDNMACTMGAREVLIWKCDTDNFVAKLAHQPTNPVAGLLNSMFLNGNVLFYTCPGYIFEWNLHNYSLNRKIALDDKNSICLAVGHAFFFDYHVRDICKIKLRGRVCKNNSLNFIEEQSITVAELKELLHIDYCRGKNNVIVKCDSFVNGFTASRGPELSFIASTLIDNSIFVLKSK
uniref:Uncharacterized protein n=1 Tax=Ciona savignyi TaxID=51511 RepID=H2ZBY0_CIOSA